MKKSNLKGKNHWKKSQKNHKQKPQASASSKDKYSFCGGDHHKRQFCPARNHTCGKCKKTGHFDRVCNNGERHINRLHEVREEEEVFFLGEVTGKEDHWKANISINGHNTSFKLDTGAAVTVVSDW